MSSVTHPEPDPDGTPVDHTRRGRARVGLPWRRQHDVDPPAVDDLDEDDAADRKVIDTAFDLGFAESVPGVQPARGLARLRRFGSTGDSDATITQLRRDAEEAVAEQDAEQRAADEAEAKAVEAQREAAARATEEARAREEAVVAAHAAESAALADAETARRGEAERWAEEQAAVAEAAHEQRVTAEQQAAEHAALAAEAVEARDQAEAKARGALGEYQQAVAEQQQALASLREDLALVEEEAQAQARALVQAEQAATAQARARAAAEQAAAEQIVARVEAEARAADLARQVAEARALLAARPVADEPAPAGPEPTDDESELILDPAAAVAAEPDATDPLFGEFVPKHRAPDAVDPSDEAAALEAEAVAASESPTIVEDDDITAERLPAVGEDTSSPAVASEGSAPRESPRPALNFILPAEIDAADPVHPAADESVETDADQSEAAEPEAVAPEPEAVAPEHAVTEPEPEVIEPETVSAEPAAASGSKHRSYHSKRGSDALAPLALLAALACAGVLGLQAYKGLLTVDLGLSIGLTVAAAALLLYAMKVSNSSRSVHLDEHGLLKMRVGETHHEFDLTAPTTKMEQVGTPGKRGWRILILRRSMSPVTIDARTVDPRSFTEALRQWRPDL